MDLKQIRYLVENTKYPILVKNNCKWPLLNWTLKEWSSQFGDRKLSFRLRPNRITEDPCWERNCETQSLAFDEFVNRNDSEKWLYFDYNYMNQCFSPESEIYQQITWSSFGYPELGAGDSTIWIGSEGSHTPCHQDTYGKNIVLQIYGRKRWILFPPESANMRPTRIPYEESSLYSQHNFYFPKNLSSFTDLRGCRAITLEPGDALIVPHQWWHYVEHVTPVGITINTWIPCESDEEKKVEESVVRTIISQFSKDIDVECLLHILNPNEDDTPDVDLNTNLSLLEKTIEHYANKKSKTNKRKRQRLGNGETSTESENIDSNLDVETIVAGCNQIAIVEEISQSEFMDILKSNYEKHKCNPDNNESDDNTLQSVDVKNNFVCNLLKAICQPNVIEQIKNNLVNECL